MRLKTPTFWRLRNAPAIALYPVSCLFAALVAVRRWCYQIKIFSSWQSPVPVIVVGNLSAGGAGKTPLVIALVEHLQRQGRKPGVVTRGYGGRQSNRGVAGVSSQSDPLDTGDEAVLLARRTGVSVVASRDRPAAVRHLLEQSACDVVICDDGLQHYALQRDIEIVVVDADYQFGNGFCLPAGPLREPVSRADDADLLVYSGEGKVEPGYKLQADGFVSNDGEDALPVAKFVQRFGGTAVRAVAAIAHPEKFYKTLQALGLDTVECEFPDHHQFVAADFLFEDELPVVMTEKDKVKCERFLIENAWYLKVTAVVDGMVLDQIDKLLAIADERVQ